MKVQKQQTDELAKIGELLERIKIGLLVTIDEEGMLRSCPMQTLELDAEGRVWFFTSASSPKVKETHAHAYWVNLRYGDPDKQNYLSLSGTAHIEHDRAKMEELYTPWVKFWHSQGLDDPDVALLCVEIEKAEHWAAPDGVVRRMMALAKALTTGDKRAIGDNEKIAVRPMCAQSDMRDA